MNNYHVEQDGYAIWAVPQNVHNGIPELDVHINIWIAPKKDNTFAYVDFGIRTYCAKNTREICCYVPFDFENEQFQDLSNLLTDKEIARGIFNTSCTINFDGKTGIAELKYNAHDSNIAEVPMSIENCSDGSIIRFKVYSIFDKLTKSELYVRFRIPNKGLGEFLRQKSDALHSFASALSSPIHYENYSYTVRLNESRILPSEILYNDAFQKQKVKKVILTVCASGAYIIDVSTCYKVRVLEENLYKNYVPSGSSFKNCMIDQWLQIKESKKDYNLTCVLRKEDVNPKSLSIYAALVTFFSALGGGIIELIKFILSIVCQKSV